MTFVERRALVIFALTGCAFVAAVFLGCTYFGFPAALAASPVICGLGRS